MSVRTILVTGGTGFLGSELVKQLTADTDLQVHATWHSNSAPGGTLAEYHRVDLCEPVATIRLLELIKPDVIIHTAARMGSDALQPPDRPGEAEPVIVGATRTLARWASHEQVRFIHLSTDVVFSGDHPPYKETDIPMPKHRYGAAKRKAEEAVILARAESMIVRTSLIYGFEPADARTKALIDGSMRRLFTDEYRNPIHVADLARTIIRLLDHPFTGILHVAGPARLSRFDFGKRIVQRLGLGLSLEPALAVESDLIRPLDCTLDCSLLKEILPELRFSIP